MNSTTLSNKDQLSAGMKCYELELPGSDVTHLPDDIEVEYRINLDGCRKLKTLPDGLKTGTLFLSGCTGTLTTS